MTTSRGVPHRAAGRLGLAALAAFAVIAAGCGSDDKASSGATTSPTTAAQSGGDGSTTVAATKSDKLKLGAIFSLSGAVAPFSEGGVHAVNLAVKQINDAGGFVVGDTKYTLELVTKDDRSDPSVATAAATELVEDAGLDIVLGPLTSVTAPAVAEYAVPRGALMFSGATGLLPMLTPESVKGDMATLFATSGDQATIADFMAQALKEQYPDVKKVAAIHDDGAIGKFVGPQFAKAAQSIGLDVVASEVYPAASTDYSALLTKIKGASPELLFVCCTSTANANIAKQAIELGVTPAFMSWGGSLRPPTSSATGRPIDQPWVVVNMPGIMEELENGQPVAARPGQLKYLEDVKNVLGEKISVNESGALYFFDYVSMLVEAMKKAGSVDDTKAIASALAEMKFDGQTLGPVSFDEKHIAHIGADWCKAIKGDIKCGSLPPPS